MRLAATVGSVPRLPQPVDWIPVDVGCTVIVELMSRPEATIHHVSNPTLRPAEALAQGAKNQVSAEVIKRLTGKLWTKELLERVKATGKEVR